MGTWKSNNADTDASDNYTLWDIDEDTQTSLHSPPPPFPEWTTLLTPSSLFVSLFPHPTSSHYILPTTYLPPHIIHTPTFPPSPSYVPVPIPIPYLCHRQPFTLWHTPLCSCTHSSQSLILYYTHRVTKTLHNSSLSSTIGLHPNGSKTRILKKKMSVYCSVLPS
jgi:hypothetical protein